MLLFRNALLYRNMRNREPMIQTLLSVCVCVHVWCQAKLV